MRIIFFLYIVYISLYNIITNSFTQDINIMKLEIHKDKRNTGKYFHRVPNNTHCKRTKQMVLKEITKYIELHDDLGCLNYISCESRVTTKLDPYTTYVYEDLY